jgi:penicillin-binding protein 2
MDNLPIEPNKTMKKRLSTLFFIIFLSFITLVGRLSDVQIVHGNEYLQQENQNSVQDIPIQAVRGNILDRQGVTVANSRVSYTAVFHEEDWMNEEYMLGLAKRLASVLQVPYDDLVTKMDFGYGPDGKYVGRQEPKFLEKDLKFDLNPQEVSKLEEHRTELYKGIQVETKSIRVYNPQQIAVQTVGYVRPFAVAVTSKSEYKSQSQSDAYLPNQPVGYDGVEESFEDYLKGTNGVKKILVDSKNNAMKVMEDTPPKKGDNVYLTIDSRIQEDAKKFTDSYLAQLRQNPNTQLVRNAYAVAIEVKTGKVVAMLSYPEYDPNIWVKGLDKNSWKQVQYRYLNGTIRPAPYDASANPDQDGKHPNSIIPSGSVIKPSTVMMALNEGLIQPDNTWRDEPDFRYGSRTDVVHNWSHKDFGILTPQKALQVSSNTYMSHLGMMLVQNNKNPISTFQKYQHDFGLGIPTKINLPNESDGTEDYVKTSKQVSTMAAIIQASFGQQEHYTTLQLANYVATIANKGERLKPLIVDKIVSPEGKLVKQMKPEVLSDSKFDDAYWNVVDEGMKMVTDQGGTAYMQFLGTPYKVAAKTGTSQQDIYVKKSDGHWGLYSKIENASFIGFAPADNPKLAVAVVVPEGGYSTESANYIARAIFDSYNKYYGLQ